ncbi:MAG TPA: hypothetical protein VKY73_09320, partial [Polyangiaceae bacterium]|nr:hypothetical protein [Polyangiaceae bacterium]
FAQRVIRFVRHDEGDADLILPSLHADKGKRKGAADSAEQSSEGIPLPASPVSGASTDAPPAPSAASTPTDSTAPPAQSMVRAPVLGDEFPAQAVGMPGLPGVDPFKD